MTGAHTLWDKACNPHLYTLSKHLQLIKHTLSRTLKFHHLTTHPAMHLPHNTPCIHTRHSTPCSPHSTHHKHNTNALKHSSNPQFKHSRHSAMPPTQHTHTNNNKTHTFTLFGSYSVPPLLPSFFILPFHFLFHCSSLSISFSLS